MVCPTSPLPAETGGKLRMFHAARVLADSDAAGQEVLARLRAGDLDPYAAVDRLLGGDDAPGGDALPDAVAGRR